MLAHAPMTPETWAGNQARAEPGHRAESAAPCGLCSTSRFCLSVPKTRFSWDHGHLSRPVPSRGMPRPGGGLRVAVSADAVEQRQRHA